MARAVALLALAVRVGLLFAFPVMPFGDGWSRLAHADQWTLSPWLPGYQVLVHLTWLVDPALPRIATAVLGAIAAGLATRINLLAGLAVAAAPALVLPGIFL